MPEAMNPADMIPVAEAFSAAAIGALPWEGAMDTVARATRSVGAVLLPAYGNRAGAPYSPAIGEVLEVYFKGGWREQDVRDRVVPLIARRGVATELDFITPEAIASHPYYQEFLKPFGLLWWAGVNIRVGDSAWALALQRSIEQGPFLKEETEILAANSVRLSSAAAIATALGKAKVQTALASFEASAVAVMLIDDKGCVLELNPSAEALLGRDLWLETRRPVSWDRDATAALGRALYILSWDKDGPASEAPVVLPRRDGRPIIAYPSRLPGVTNDHFTSARMILILHDLDRSPPGRADVLARAFRLTRGEAQLAVRLADGDSLEAVAQEMSVTYETARTRLKSIMQKTDTHRQGELISLLARLRARPDSEA